MVSERKTLIIFDTCILRFTEDDDVTYDSFEFGRQYRDIESFIQKNGLSDYVKIAVPRIVVEELKKQKAEQYSTDVDVLSRIYSRLSRMPNIDLSTVKMPSKDFDCPSHIEQLAGKYLAERDVQVIDYPQDRLNKFFQSIIKRAIQLKPPFKRTGKYSDSGFKDALIWESILNFNGITEFDNVILLTTDNNFNDECKNEFQTTLQKYISFVSSGEYLLQELAGDYEEHIKNNQLTNFGGSEYFKDYLSKEVSKKKHVIVDEQKREILRIEISDYCKTVEIREEKNEDETYEIRVVSSSLKVVFKSDTNEIELQVTAQTFLDDAMSIDHTVFDFELIEQ